MLSPSIQNFVYSMFGLVLLGVGMWHEGAFNSAFSIGIFLLLAGFLTSEKVEALFAALSQQRELREIRRIAKDEQLTGFKRIEEALEKKLELRRIGNHMAGLEYCTKKLALATRFEDTYLRTATDDFNTARREVTDSFYNAVCDMIVERGGTFDCIMSDVNGSIFSEVLGAVEDRLRTNGKLGLFKIHRLKHGKIPIMGIQILHYDHQLGSEVVFGWNVDNSDKGVVFASSDHAVVRYFTYLYEGLKGACGAKDLSLTNLHN